MVSAEPCPKDQCADVLIHLTLFTCELGRTIVITRGDISAAPLGSGAHSEICIAERLSLPVVLLVPLPDQHGTGLQPGRLAKDVAVKALFGGLPTLASEAQQVKSAPKACDFSSIITCKKRTLTPYCAWALCPWFIYYLSAFALCPAPS